MAASLGLYKLKPLSFCNQTTRVAVILFTFISDLKRLIVKDIQAAQNIFLTFEEHADNRAGIHVPLQVQQEVCACMDCLRALIDTSAVCPYTLAGTQWNSADDSSPKADDRCVVTLHPRLPPSKEGSLEMILELGRSPRRVWNEAKTQQLSLVVQIQSSPSRSKVRISVTKRWTILTKITIKRTGETFESHPEVNS